AAADKSIAEPASNVAKGDPLNKDNSTGQIAEKKILDGGQDKNSGDAATSENVPENSSENSKDASENDSLARRVHRRHHNHHHRPSHSNKNELKDQSTQKNKAAQNQEEHLQNQQKHVPDKASPDVGNDKKLQAELGSLLNNQKESLDSPSFKVNGDL